MLLEGVEVAFIVLAVGAGRGMLTPAIAGALAACVVVVLIGVAVRRPLSRVPENTLKFAVGVMLSAFGLFWTGENWGSNGRVRTPRSLGSRRCSSPSPPRLSG